VIPVNAFTRLRTSVVLALATAALLALAGCSSSTAPEADGGGGGGKKGKGKGAGGGAGAPVPVLVAAAMQRDVPIEIAAVGTVESYNPISVKSLVTGEITNVYFKEGDYVHTGDKLFTIDSRSYEAQLKQAEANLKKDQAAEAQANANLKRDESSQQYASDTAKRYQGLLQDGIVSRDQSEQLASAANASANTVAADKAAIESAQAQIAADDANINNVKVQLSWCTQYATIDGRTGNVTVKKGNVVTANSQEVLTINQVSPIYVTFSIPEAKLPDVRKYMAVGKLPVFAKPQDASGPGEQGEITFIDNSVDTTTGTIKLKGTFPNGDLKLWPGQFLNVTLRLTTVPNAITVPNQAVQNGQDGQFIYVVGSDSKVEARPVTIGERVDQDLVILSGLQAGETVVTDGQLRLQPGSVVSIGEGPGTGGRGKGRGKKQDSPDGAPRGKG
jgi:multidrug efflux system membrane fusion protein